MTTDGDDEVGYGKPPRSGRFQKGRSGNPKGRPRKAKAKMSSLDLANLPTEKLLREEHYRPVTAKTAKGVTTIPFNQALIQKRQAMALGGNRLVGEQVLREIRQQELERAMAADKHSQNLEIIKTRNQHLIDEASAAGEPPPQILPHPDDIVRDPTSYRYVLFGPFDEEDLAYFEWWQKYQLLLLLQSEMLYRDVPVKKNSSWHDESDLSLASGALARYIDRNMPPSMRWSDAQWWSATKDARRMTDKRLRGALRETFFDLMRTTYVLRSPPSIPPQNFAILRSFLKGMHDAVRDVLPKCG